MKNIPVELKEYVKIYYDFNKQYNIPDNINIYILEKEEFFKKISNKITEVFRLKDPNIDKYINGLVIVDTKNKYKYTYNVYLLREEVKIYPYLVSVLFHELSHIHTLPKIEIYDLKKYDENNKFSEKGYFFWKEFIANYIGDKTFFYTYGDIGYIQDKEKLINLFNSCFYKDKLIENIDELISFILLSEHNIESDINDSLTYDKYNTFLKLLEICNCLIKKIENVTIEDFHIIGQLINYLEN
jgi:hypothetical protein